jgi:ParB/RepB/Spo0J family partition protein
MCAEMKSEAMIFVPVNKILADKDENSRENLREIDELGESIRVDGQITPCLVTMETGGDGKPTGKFRLISGFRRLKAIQKLNKAGVVTTVLCRVLDQLETADALWFNLLENLHRHSLTGFEEVQRYHELITVHKWKAKDIAARYGSTDDKASGMSVGNINNLVRAFESLTPSARDAWRKNELTKEAVILLAAMSVDDQDSFLIDAKHRSGASLQLALDAWKGNARVDANGNPIAVPAARGKGGRNTQAKPGPKGLMAAYEWAKSENLKEVSDVLAWVMGTSGSMTLQIGDLSFAPPKKGRKKSVKD